MLQYYSDRIYRKQYNSMTSTTPPIESRPTFKVHQLNAELARICNPLFKSFGVDLITSRILVIVLEQPNIGLGDIVRLMALPQSTVSHQIKRLVNQDLIARTANLTDKRLFSLQLTRQGAAIAEACNHLSQDIYTRLFRDLSTTQLQALNDGLTLMAQCLTRLETQEIDPATYRSAQ